MQRRNEKPSFRLFTSGRRRAFIFAAFYTRSTLFDRFYLNPAERFEARTVRLQRFMQHLVNHFASEPFL